MRKFIVAALGLFALSPACEDATTVEPEVTISATCQTSFDPPPAPLPAVFKQVDTGTCQVAGRGEMAFSSTKYIDVQAGKQVISELTLTGTNGDVLRGTGIGNSLPASPGVINFTAELTFNGGVGQFNGAQGKASVTGSANMMQRKANFTIEGRVRTQ